MDLAAHTVREQADAPLAAEDAGVLRGFGGRWDTAPAVTGVECADGQMAEIARAVSNPGGRRSWER